MGDPLLERIGVSVRNISPRCPNFRETLRLSPFNRKSDETAALIVADLEKNSFAIILHRTGDFATHIIDGAGVTTVD